MRNRFAALVAASTLAVAGTAIIAPPAQADTEDCVSKIEFGKVKNGWTKTRVHNVFDVSGKQTSYYSGYGKYQTREYRPCTGNPYSYVSVDYVWRKKAKAWHVEGKSAYWG